MSVITPPGLPIPYMPNYQYLTPYYLYANAGLQYQDARSQFHKGRTFLGDEYGFHINAGLWQLTNALQNDLTLIKRDNAQMKQDMALIKARLNIQG